MSVLLPFECDAGWRLEQHARESQTVEDAGLVDAVRVVDDRRGGPSPSLSVVLARRRIERPRTARACCSIFRSFIRCWRSASP